jgi:hypothetical protein
MSWVLYFQDQTTNACAFLLINESLNEDKYPNHTINHRSPRAKRFANYALKTGMEGVSSIDTKINNVAPFLMCIP